MANPYDFTSPARSGSVLTCCTNSPLLKGGERLSNGLDRGLQAEVGTSQLSAYLIRHLFTDKNVSQPYLHKFAVMSRQVYTVVNMLPRWVLLVVTGGLSSLIISAFHRIDKYKNAVSRPIFLPWFIVNDLLTGLVC
jgi:hypothetical protein